MANKTSMEPEQSPTEKSTDEDFGYSAFPNRGKSGSGSSFDRIFNIRFNIKCLERMRRCIKDDPTIALIAEALNSHGCTVDPARHFVCEDCVGARAGYDNRARQIVLCQNLMPLNQYCGVMAHELIHAFDDCRAKLSFKNAEHVACSEIRAANLTQCGFMESWRGGTVRLGQDMAEKQKECVRKTATKSLMATHNLSEEKAEVIMDKVWYRCYNDLEPLGRRYRPDAVDRDIAYSEAYSHGYTRRRVLYAD